MNYEMHDQRPGIASLRQQIRDGLLSFVMTAHEDRISRVTSRRLVFERGCRQSGVRHEQGLD